MLVGDWSHCIICQHGFECHMMWGLCSADGERGAPNVQVDTQRNRIIATAALKKAEPLADQGMNIPQSLVCLDAGRQKLNNQLSIAVMFLKHACMLLLVQIVSVCCTSLWSNRQAGWSKASIEGCHCHPGGLCDSSEWLLQGEPIYNAVNLYLYVVVIFMQSPFCHMTFAQMCKQSIFLLIWACLNG